jgi:hypothetical protein
MRTWRVGESWAWTIPVSDRASRSTSADARYVDIAIDTLIVAGCA